MNRKPKGRHRVNALSSRFVRNVSRPGRFFDGNALYLCVKPTGARSWIQRIVIRGRRRHLGLGAFPLVSLAEARKQALANRKLARNGGDPLAERRRAAAMPSFQEAAERVWADKRPGWRHPRHANGWMSSLRRYAFPCIGRLPVNDVTSADVLDALQRIWHIRPQTARRVRQRIGAVMEWVVAMGYRSDNPCDCIGPVLGPQQHLIKHMQALPHREVAAAIRALQATGATEPVKLALEFLVLTAARSGEVRGAVWEEIDLEAAVWTLPATRTKSKREHRVPLSRRALEILTAARKLRGGTSTLVFPSQHGGPIGATRFSRLLSRHKIGAVPHGFRSSFRDWAAETTSSPREVIEAALAHAVLNQTEAAYARSDLFERRRRLMNEWAAYLEDGHAQALPL